MFPFFHGNTEESQTPIARMILVAPWTLSQVVASMEL